jgi:hypothetical protein
MRDQSLRCLCLIGIFTLAGCGSSESVHTKKVFAEPSPAPDWVTKMKGDDANVCGMGVAGAGFEDSPYPKQLARERAVKNLAGIIGTDVEEAMIEDETIDGEDIQYARVVHVDDDLVKTIDGAATISYWVDVHGEGPYEAKNFVYGWACIPKTTAASTLKVDPNALKNTHNTPAMAGPDTVPRWIQASGKRKDGRVCAVGYSDPTFQPENTFENVVEDVRTQLAQTVDGLVASSFQNLSTDKSEMVESLTAESSTAVAKGVVITRFWFDPKGNGPERRKRSTYGFGCVYPMDIVAASLAKTDLPQATVAEVKKHAEAAFNELDAAEASSAGGGAGSRSAAAGGATGGVVPVSPATTR